MDKDDNTIVLEPAQPESAASTVTLGGETVTLDFGSLTLPSQSLSYSYSGSSIDTISIPTITSIGSSSYNTSSYSNYTWNNSFSSDPAVKIDSNGLDIKEGGDIKVGGKQFPEEHKAGGNQLASKYLPSLTLMPSVATLGSSRVE